MILKGLGVDFGNVVGIFDTPDWFKFIREHQGNHLEPREIFASLIPIIKRHDLGQITNHEFFEEYRNVYKLKVTEKEFFDKLGSIFWIDREMLELINILKKRGIAVFLITNMNPFHAEFIRRHYPEVFASFDYRMISCQAGVAKPDEKAFTLPLEALDLESAECIYVDDSYDNIEKSCQLGYKGWHYNVTDEYFCPNGRLDEERLKFKNFISCLDEVGLLSDKNKARF